MKVELKQRVKIASLELIGTVTKVNKKTARVEYVNEEGETVEALFDLADLKPAEVKSQNNQLKAYRQNYKKCHTAAGDPSLNNGDELAQYLEGKDHIEVCRIADSLTPNKDGESHMMRYQKLNNGSKRMNAGNKIRAALKRESITIEEVKAA